MIGKGHHRLTVIRRSVCPGRRARLRPVPPGEDLGVALNYLLIVCRNRLILLIELLRPVRIQLIQADGKQLHHLPRVIFVRRDVSLRIRLVIVDHVEGVAHGRVQGNVFQQYPEVAKGVMREEVPVNSHTLRAAEHVICVGGDDHDFTQSESNTLPKLVRSGHDGVPPSFLK